MAKIYDALKRAEAERKRHTEEAPPPAARLDFDKADIAAPKAKKPRLLKRIFSRKRMKKVRVSAGDVNKRRIALLQPDSYVAEQYRALRGRIDAYAAQRPIRTLAVTSALPGEGKTTASINLAIVTAMSLGRRVLLIDCDLRRPKVHESLGLRPSSGLAEVLTGTAELEDAITTMDGVDLDVLPVKARPLNPSELLGSSMMRELVEEVAKRYDRVILDTPAVLGLPDAKTVSEISDGMVMVVRADMTSEQDVQATLEILDRRRLLGLVLNGAQVDQGRYGYSA